jgi:hypothetical protein
MAKENKTKMKINGPDLNEVYQKILLNEKSYPYGHPEHKKIMIYKSELLKRHPELKERTKS